MRYRFDAFELDTGQFRLRRGPAEVRIEPLVFDLLTLFLRNPGTVIDRDRMIAEVWDGRIVSDATLSTAVKSARRALGDSGAAQGFIETVRGRGFRFAAPVEAAGGPEAAAPDGAVVPAGGAPSIAVLPFERLGTPTPWPGLEDAVPHDIILALSRLHWMFVTARGSSFRFRGAVVDFAAVRRALGVRYCLTGSVEVAGRRLSVAAELCDTATAGVVWAERFGGVLDDVHALRAEIVAGIAAALEARIQLNEARQAEGRPAENLDAWQAFHLGLKDMHLYTEAGNEAAAARFRRAIALEPGFARAHAGLSFTHFQAAFLRYRPDRDAEIAAALRCAERGVALDPLDPFASVNMGRGLWLMKDLDAAQPWLERAVAISPSFAQGIYSRALVDSLSGNHAAAAQSADLAMALSPLDPLLYAMRGARALAAIAAGDFADAARWAEAAARTPRAHAIIDLIAAASHTLAGDPAAARRWATVARQRRPDVGQDDFFDGLPVRHAETRARISAALAGCGLPAPAPGRAGG